MSSKLVTPKLNIRHLGLADYKSTLQSMQDFTKKRNENTLDELWIVEHSPVFTLGRNGKKEHILQDSIIPVINVDRGGQVTYHGPGQIVIYFLLDLHRRKLGIRRLVTLIEECIIELLGEYKLIANSDPKAPGVYIDGKKIAALGLRVSKGRTTHGLSLNVNMDLTPFTYINPCGYKGLEVTQTSNLGIEEDMSSISSQLQSLIEQKLQILFEENLN